jgi:hypothetical protein
VIVQLAAVVLQDELDQLGWSRQAADVGRL